MVQLVSLGAWCRTAHQTRVYSERRDDVQAGTFPYDWMITSFAALRKTLDPAFDPTHVLQPEHTRVSRFNSVVCTASQVIFHHAIGPEQVEKLGDLSPGDALPDSQKATNLVRQSRERFDHTFRNLKAATSGEAPLVFVRWLRGGHPEAQFPEAFEGESPETLCDVIANYLGHRDFYLLVVETEQVGPGAAIADPFVSFEPEDRVIKSRIRERPGWNGENAPNFRGDEPSWEKLLDRALETWGLTQAAPLSAQG